MLLLTFQIGATSVQMWCHRGRWCIRKWLTWVILYLDKFDNIRLNLKLWFTIFTTPVLHRSWVKYLWGAYAFSNWANDVLVYKQSKIQRAKLCFISVCTSLILSFKSDAKSFAQNQWIVAYAGDITLMLYEGHCASNWIAAARLSVHYMSNTLNFNYRDNIMMHMMHIWWRRAIGKYLLGKLDIPLDIWQKTHSTDVHIRFVWIYTQCLLCKK